MGRVDLDLRMEELGERLEVALVPELEDPAEDLLAVVGHRPGVPSASIHNPY